ncbi:hypothetical protein SD81_020870 [Tolypothrix campylonemoides VB511288]|nr:hypothetical protein SD81_020870 [Tolypothrix campylonemoides VB511288]
MDAIALIQIRHVREWLDSLQEADTTKKVKHLNILKAFFSYVTSLEKPPISRSPIPKQFKLPKPKDTQVERILAPSDGNDCNKLALVQIKIEDMVFSPDNK